MIREKIIIEIIKDKDVLDIGSLGQTGEYCLWNIIKSFPKSLTGIDLAEAPQKAREMFSVDDVNLHHQQDKRIVYGNMETVDLGNDFDIIIAGDIIEHVSNQGLFLNNIYRHLRESGKLIITTPNAKWPTVFCKPNPTHVLWHDRYTLATLLNRHKFKIEMFRFYYGNKLHYSWWKIPLIARQAMLVMASKI